MHPTQRDILDSLRRADVRKFGELLLDVAETSDNLTYHLKQMQKHGLIESPAKGWYKLAPRGLVYLNNNLELGNELFPTMSCMLKFRGQGGKVLVMRKLKQPYLGSTHLPTFGIESKKSLQEQTADFLHRYHIAASGLTFKGVHRERAMSEQGQPFFDKFFMVFEGNFTSFEQYVDDREFMALPSAGLSENPQLLPASKAVLSRGSEVIFAEAIASE